MKNKNLEPDKILWSNKTWQIEKISPGELKIATDYSACYCYISEDFNTLMCDRIIFPKYVEKKAIQLARKYIVSIYAN